MLYGALVYVAPWFIWVIIFRIIDFLVVPRLTDPFRRKYTIAKRVLVGIIVVQAVLNKITSPRPGLEECLSLHRAACAQSDAPEQYDLHRNLEHDVDITNCSSAAKGDYGPCLRNNLNHSQHKEQVAYDAEDTMRFFFGRRPRLLEPRPLASIFNYLTSDKHSFDVSYLSPTQREGLALWSKCTYPPFYQTLTQPLNLSCPFQAFNLLFFHNTLGDGQMFLSTESINRDPPPKRIDEDLQDALTVSVPQKDPVDRFFPRRILHIGATPLLNMTPPKIEHTPQNLAKILSQLLHEMLHVTHYIYTCPICYSEKCVPLGLPKFINLRFSQAWLPLTVAIDLMLAKEGVLKIPGVNWKEHRLNLHADHVAAAIKYKSVILPMQSELNGEERGPREPWRYVSFKAAYQGRLLDLMKDGIMDPDFPSWRSDSAPYVVA